MKKLYIGLFLALCSYKASLYSMNLKDTIEESPLHDAILKGRTDKVKRLLACNNADTNAQNSGKESSLHLAVFAQQPDITKLLLKSKADTNARDLTARTPLDYAAAHGHARIIKQLLKYGACITSSPTKDYLLPKIAQTLQLPESDDTLENLSPLMWTIVTGDSSLFNKYLHASTAELSETTHSGETALMLAYKYKQLELKSLIKSKIKQALKDISAELSISESLAKLIGHYTYGYKK